MLPRMETTTTATIAKNEHRQQEHDRLLNLSSHQVGGMTGESLGLLLFGFFALIGLSAVGYRFYSQRRQRQRRIALARQRARSATNDSSFPLKQRKAHIEAYLVTKPVSPHDFLCDAARGHPSNAKLSRKGTMVGTDTAAADEDGLSINEAASVQAEACTICFESFEPSDLVSWSPNPACCKRVFHHACFKEWLLQNQHCPWCRETVLPVDGYSPVKTTKKQIQDLLMAQQQRSVPTFYCCAHGIVRPDQSIRGQCAVALEQRSTYLCSRAEILAQRTIAHSDEGVTNSSCTIPQTVQTSQSTTVTSSDNQEERDNVVDRDLEVGLVEPNDESCSMKKSEEEGSYDTGEESVSAASSFGPEEEVP